MEIKSSNIPYEMKQLILQDIRKNLGENEYQKLLNSFKEEDIVNSYLNQINSQLKTKVNWKKKTKKIIGLTFRIILFLICSIGYWSGMANINVELIESLSLIPKQYFKKLESTNDIWVVRVQSGNNASRQSAISRIENHAEDIRLSTLKKFAKSVGRKLEVNLS